ncbi:MAG: GNAT family N-acetyltransferase [Verrucomicrobia bacterium]|nr:GNAT family N-acetyltransferase [Verrucomicrobiota bacterium]
MILKTIRLIIREFTQEDIDALASLLGNQQVMEFSVAGPLSKEQTQEYLMQRILPHYANHGFGLWAVVYEGEVIGYAGLLSQLIDGENLVELGYRLIPQYWGRGLASEAASAIAHYGFEKLKLNKIISIIEAKNGRSISVAKRLGMHYWKDADFHGKVTQIYHLTPPHC